jgi:hypothetical protein
MTPWNMLYREVVVHLEELVSIGCDLPFFRGHADARWELKPSLARGKGTTDQKENIEKSAYYDFLSLGGPLLNEPTSSWHTLFSMQHHGIPTRLLDWTLSFATATYFALKGDARKPKEACIWVLNPYALNKITCGDEVVLTPPGDFQGSYYENFITREKSFEHGAVAINPVRIDVRQVAQDSTFTVSGTLFKSIDRLAPAAVRSFLLPPAARKEAEVFIRLAGVNEHKLFPDLDGIARHIMHHHFRRRK